MQTDFEQLKLLLYGSPGSGKTVLIGSILDLPPAGYLPVLLLDFEQGQRSIKSKCHTIERSDKEIYDTTTSTKRIVHSYNVEQLKAPVMDKVNRIFVDTWEDFREAYRLLTTSVPFKTYKTLAIDSISQVDRICQDAVARNTMKDPFGVKPITQPEMGQLGTHMVWLIKAFLQTGANLIVTAHITQKEDPGYAAPTNLPMLTGIKLRQEMCALCDAVGYTYTHDSETFNLSFSKKIGTYCKFRAEEPMKVAGKVFTSHIDPSKSKNEFNLKTFLKAIGDIRE